MQNQNDLKLGIIVNCLWAQIYEEPNTNSRTLKLIGSLEEVRVVKEFERFFQILTSDDVNGYCLKKYIVFKE